MENADLQIIGIIISFVFGLLCGSFATMASHRIPRNEELVIKPSHCPKCNHRLGFFDLFPVFSWLLNCARCRYCKGKIHWRYPAIELTTATAFAFTFANLGLTILGFFVLLSIVYIIVFVTMQLEK